MNIVVVGSSGHAKCVIDSVELAGRFRIIGLVDDFRTVDETTLSYKVLGTISDLPNLVSVHQLSGFIVAIGDNFARAAVTSKVKLLCPELDLICAIHPSAIVARGAVIGAGSMIMAGAVIAPTCEIGIGCIINTGASIDHDSAMHDFSSIGPRAVTGGNCQIGTFTAIGIGSVLSHRICIGAHCVIGAGAVVLRAVESFSVSYGSPARHIRTRIAGEKYL
jgi:sugar O-acyltransferase (sialic acid O-acetyltransferase NeuD family)